MTRENGGQRRAFVCGHPIAHSRSPIIHRHWLESLGIEGSYEPIDVAPRDFASFLERLPSSGYAGGNVTIPHKEAAFASIASRDETAEATGAVNTVWIEDGTLHGANSDVAGFEANLDEFTPQWRHGRRAVVLGAGGAARAVLLALQRTGHTDIRVVNRTMDRARDLAHRFGSGIIALPQAALKEAMSDADLFVNATSLGMKGERAADTDSLPAGAIVTDIVYVPIETPLLKSARARGLNAVDGLGMLLHQAVPGFPKWFGVQPAVTPRLRELVLADISGAR